MFKTAYNPNETPVVVDDLGHVIPGLDWGTVETTANPAKDALDAGLLVLVERPGRNANVEPDAAEAFDRTENVAIRSRAFDGLDRDALFGLAVDAGLYADDDEQPYKADLVARLTHSTADVPEKTGRKATTEKTTEES